MTVEYKLNVIITKDADISTVASEGWFFIWGVIHLGDVVLSPNIKGFWLQ